MRARRARAGDAAHAHVAGADPHDGDADAADLRRRARPHLPPRHARRPPLAGVPPDRGARRRRGHHARRSVRHDRGVHPRALRRPTSARASCRRSSRSPSRRPSSRCRASSAAARAAACARSTGWIELGGCGHGRPERVRRASASTPRSTPGFAFGFGIDRIASSCTASTRSRTFLDGDVRFLRSSEVRSVRAPLSWIREFTPLDDARSRHRRRARTSSASRSRRSRSPGARSPAWSSARILDVVAAPRRRPLRLADVDFGDGQLRVVCGAPNVEAGHGRAVRARRRGAARRLHDRAAQDPRRRVRRHAVLGARARPRRRPRRHPRARPPTRRSAPTCARCSASTTSCSTSRSRRTGPTRCASSASPASSPRTSACRSRVDEHEPGADRRRRSPARTWSSRRPTAARASSRVAARVTMGESPAWMQRRLRAGGHAADQQRRRRHQLRACSSAASRCTRSTSAGSRAAGIVVRLAADGEKMTTLDGVERALTADDLLICDAERVPQAHRRDHGRRRGRGLRRHHRDPARVGVLRAERASPAASKRLGLRSEASARFERGIDPNGAGTRRRARDGAARRGRGARRRPPARSTCTRSPIERARITVRTERVNRLLGTDARRRRRSRRTSRRSASRCDGDDGVASPDLPARPRTRDRPRRGGRAPGRPRPHRAHGAVEPGEGRRAHAAPARPPRASPTCSSARATTRLHAAAARAGRPRARRRRSPTRVIEVENPLRAEESILRPRCCPGCCARSRTTPRTASPTSRCSRCGTVFAPPARRRAAARRAPRTLAFARAHDVRRAPHEADRPVDVYDATAALAALARGARHRRLRSSRRRRIAGFHPARGRARRWSTARRSASSARSRASVLDALALAAPVVACELDVDALLDGAAPRPARPARVALPASAIDLAFVVADDGPRRRALQATLATRRRAARARRAVRRVPLRRARRRARSASRSRCGSARPTARSPTPRSSALRQRCIDAVVAAHGAELRS